MLQSIVYLIDTAMLYDRYRNSLQRIKQARLIAGKRFVGFNLVHNLDYHECVLGLRKTLNTVLSKWPAKTQPLL